MSNNMLHNIVYLIVDTHILTITNECIELNTANNYVQCNLSIIDVFFQKL